MLQKRITYYEVRFTSGDSVLPRLWLGGEDGKWMGQAVFYPDNAELPKDWADDNGKVSLYFHRSSLDPLMVLFRSDESVYLMWQGTDGENGFTTGVNPIGGGQRLLSRFYAKDPESVLKWLGLSGPDWQSGIPDEFKGSSRMRE